MKTMLDLRPVHELRAGIEDFSDRWLVERWLPRRGVGLIAGLHPAEQRALAINLATRIAAGDGWAFRKIAHGPVAFLDGDIASDGRQFLAEAGDALMRQPPLHIGQARFDICDATDFADVVAQLSAHKGGWRAVFIGGQLSLVTLDREELRVFANACRRLARALDCAVVIVAPATSHPLDDEGRSSFRLSHIVDATCVIETSGAGGEFVMHLRSVSWPDNTRTVWIEQFHGNYRVRFICPTAEGRDAPERKPKTVFA